MAKTVKAQLKCRHDTAANWTAKNPVLLEGELGVETDTTFFKIGDGATAWTSLKYVTSKSAVYDSVGRRIDTSYLPLSGGTLTGNLTAPSFQTGSGAANYFQCQKFRGEGNADTYYHAIDFGYAGHDQVDFYEYGGTWNFWKNTASTKGGTLVGAIKPSGWNGNVVGNVTGNADTATTATKLQTARTISLTGDITGSASFDGSSNISINASRPYVVGEAKVYNVNLSTLDTTKFYPIIFDPESIILRCEIHSPDLGGDEPYNQNTISFSLLAKGWSDTGSSFSIDAYNVYQSNEITIGCIGKGTNAGHNCVWVRGGLSYWIISNRKPILHTEDVTFTGEGTETYTVGTNYYGGTGNNNVSIIFTPQQTITSGSWHDGMAYGLFEKATKDASGNVITDTYATKDYVAQAIKEALAAATITYDGKVTYKG